MSSSSGRSKDGDRAGEKKCSGCGGGGAAHICTLEDLPGPAHAVIASMLPDGNKWGRGTVAPVGCVPHHTWLPWRRPHCCVCAPG